MGVYGYIFQATSAAEGVTEEAQRGAIREFADKIDQQVDEMIVEEGISAAQTFQERPQGARLFHGLQPGDVIITMKAQWVLASASEGGKLTRELRKRAISLYCVDLGENISMPAERKLIVSEGSALLVQKLLDTLALCERRGHGEAIRTTKRIKKKQGKYLGGPVPFGWRVNEEGYLVQDPGQQKIIEEIRRLREDRWSLRDISQKLRDRLGIKMSHEGIRRILANEKYRKDSERKRLKIKER